MSSDALNPVTPNQAEAVVESAVEARWTWLAAKSVFIITIFVSATLVFLVQPILARMILPHYGGTPAVWNTSLVFFQAVLLFGYTFAHLVRKFVPTRWQGPAYLIPIALATVTLPLSVKDPDSFSVSSPTLTLLATLFLAAGLPYFVVSASSPLIQYWYSRLNFSGASNPYWLYAASNVGSLLALLSYPLVIEPLTTVSQQRAIWSGAYMAFIVLVAVCSLLTLRTSAGAITAKPDVEGTLPSVRWRERLRWLVLALLPSSMMVGTTNFLSTDVAAIPLLWVAPLSLYLLTFILAFSDSMRIPQRVLSIGLCVLAAPVVITILSASVMPTAIVVVLHLVVLFVIALLSHQRLAGARPPASRLTEFFFFVSLGGVIGGSVNTLIAPLLFDQVLEYPTMIVLAFALLDGRALGRGILGLQWSRLLKPFVMGTSVALIALGLAANLPVIVIASAGLLLFTLLYRGSSQLAGKLTVVALSIAFAFVFQSASEQASLFTERTFFGVLRVVETKDDFHVLAHGTTNHGAQDLSTPESRLVPRTYFGRSGPIGDVFAQANSSGQLTDVGIIGLGIGTMAVYGEPHQEFTFYEIDPEVVEIASNPEYFTYLEDTTSAVNIVVGDGRLRLEGVEESAYQLLIMDAFSSDAVPVHLLTREAFDLYMSVTSDDGLIAVNISNRNIDLQPVLSAMARDRGLSGYIQVDDQLTEEERDAGMQASIWVVLSENPDALGGFESNSEWISLAEVEAGPVWTDDYSNIVSLIKWFD